MNSVPEHAATTPAPGTGPRVGIAAPLKTWGGLERKFTVLAREFLRRGVGVDFICLRGGQVPYPDAFPPAARIVDLQTRSKVDGIPALARYLRDRPVSALLTAKDHAAQVALLASGLSRSRTPVFIKMTNMPSEVLRRRGQRFMARRLYPRAAGVIAISQGVYDDVVDHFRVPPARCHMIYNPVLTDDFPARLARPVTHPWLAGEADTPVLVGAGRLTGQKDFASLIRALALVRRARACRLIILGEGVERPRLEQLAAELGVQAHVDLPGQVDDPVPYMAAASAFVFSSRYEGLGNVLVEAMAAGTRLVSTDCPSGPREILEDGRHGRLVPPGDVEALAGGILAALPEPRPDPERIRAAVRRFDAGRVAAAYLRTMGLCADSADTPGSSAGG